MVRLREFIEFYKLNNKKAFQFQYGAIKSILELTDAEAEFNISIPVWCD